MTLLASERSLLIRNKFRSVLQLRIQNRKQNEINADSGLKTTCPSQRGEKDQGEALRLTDYGAIQKSPPSGLDTETAKDGSMCGAQRLTKTQKSEVLNARVQYLTRSQEQEHKHTLPLDNCPLFFPLSADVFEDDISSCSTSSPEQNGVHKSPTFSSSPGLACDQLLSDLSPASQHTNSSPGQPQSGLALLPATGSVCQPIGITLGKSNSMATTGRPNGMYLTSQNSPLLPKTAQPSSPSCSSSLSPTLNSSRLPRPRKPRDAKPKMRKLKYHQYIPPNQRGGPGTGGGGAKTKSPASSQPLDPAYSRLLKQQQVFVQLQILQSQQQQQQQQQQPQQPQQAQQQQHQKQLIAAPSGDADQNVRFSDAVPPNSQPVPATKPHPVDTSPSLKQELLPPNLVDLTVSELRQQLRKRGLPVSGTKPVLLQRLQPFQLPRTCLTPAPLCQLGSSPETFTTSPMHHLNQSPCPSSSSGPDSPSSSPNQQVYIGPSRIPDGTIVGSPKGLPDGVPNRILNTNGFSGLTSVSVAREPCCPSSTVFLGPATTPSETPSPSLPLSSSSSPLQSSASWRTEQEQQRLQQQELNVLCDMRKRIRNRPRNSGTDSVACGALHPFLQQDTGCSRGKLETDAQPEVVFTQLSKQVFCCQPCEAIAQDLELPVQITVSPAPSSHGARSLEEELQEAIQKAQMDPSQSIDDILDEPVTYSVVTAGRKSPEHLAGVPAESPQEERSQSSHHDSKDDNFLSSPLCSSLLLELPPSPAAVASCHVTPAPPPLPLCASPPSAAGTSRKRKAAAMLDAADWLEMLTSGFCPLTPPAAPFVEIDFSLDSDLNVNRVLDLMIEQW